MPPYEPSPRALGLMKPGRALTGVMVALGAIWLMFAIAVNWGGATEDLFLLFCAQRFENAAESLTRFGIDSGKRITKLASVLGSVSREQEINDAIDVSLAGSGKNSF